MLSQIINNLEQFDILYFSCSIHLHRSGIFSKELRCAFIFKYMRFFCVCIMYTGLCYSYVYDIYIFTKCSHETAISKLSMLENNFPYY
jgi:hypothetical protein